MIYFSRYGEMRQTDTGGFLFHDLETCGDSRRAGAGGRGPGVVGLNGDCFDCDRAGYLAFPF